MAIKEITKATLGKAKVGWRWDAKRKLFVTWKLDTTFRGKRYVRRGFQTKQAAESHLDDLKASERLRKLGLISRTVQHFPLLSDLLSKRFTDVRSKHERARVKRVFATFQAVIGKDVAIDKVTRKHFKEFADIRLDQLVAKQQSEKRKVDRNQAKRTVNREIAPLSKAFSSVEDYFEIDGWERPRVFKFKVATGNRTRIIEPDEYNALLKYFYGDQIRSERSIHFRARRRTGLTFQMLLMTGLRHGEVSSMERSKLNIKRRMIDVYRSKSQRWKEFSPLTDSHLWCIDEALKLHPKSKFIFSVHGIPHYKIYPIMRRACATLGIPYGKNTENGFIIHDTRHTFTTFLHQKLIDNRTTLEFTDNPTAIDRYQHATRGSKIKAMNAIETEFGNGDNPNAELRKLFDCVKDGRVSFEEFEKLIADSLTVF